MVNESCLLHGLLEFGSKLVISTIFATNLPSLPFIGATFDTTYYFHIAFLGATYFFYSLK